MTGVCRFGKKQRHVFARFVAIPLDNIITQNSVTGDLADGGGILVSKCASDESIIIQDNSITNNHSDNWGGCICIQGTFGVHIDGNDISSNDAVAGGGISLWEGGLAEGASALIRGNNIVDNQGIGIYISNNCSSVIGAAKNNANAIIGNTEYALHNDSNNDIDATYNYWSTTVETEIRNAIWDYDDDESNGVVNYEPWLDETLGKVFPFAQALSSDGVDDHVYCEDDESLNPVDAITISMWLYLSTDPNCDERNNARSLLHKGDLCCNSTGYDIIFEQWRAFTWDVGTVDGALRYHGHGAQLPIGKWTFITFVYDSSTSQAKIYFNGKEISGGIWENNTGGGNIQPNTAPLLINNPSSVFCGGNFPGLIDEVRIWNIARTQEEIQSTMNTTLRGDEEELVGYWNFDDGTANDSSPYGKVCKAVGIGRRTFFRYPSSKREKEKAEI